MNTKHFACEGLIRPWWGLAVRQDAEMLGCCAEDDSVCDGRDRVKDAHKDTDHESI